MSNTNGNNKIKYLKQGAATLVILFGLLGTVWGAQKVFVTAKEFSAWCDRVAKNETRLDNKIRSDQILQIRAQIFQIEQMYHGKQIPPNEAQRLHQLRMLLRDLETNG